MLSFSSTLANILAQPFEGGGALARAAWFAAEPRSRTSGMDANASSTADGGAAGTVVATDPVSANADCDNGSAALHGPARRRRDEEREAHRVARARKRRPGNTRPGPAAAGGANLYARCPHVVTGTWSLRGLEVALLIYLNRLMRDAAYEVRRILLLGNCVNRPSSGPACDLLYGPARIREPLLRVHKRRLCKLLLARRSHDG